MKNRREFDNGGMLGIFLTDISWCIFSAIGYQFTAIDFALSAACVLAIWFFFHLLDNGKIC